jgi:formylglycine-generating enzyme required for sulfatase activity
MKIQPRFLFVSLLVVLAPLFCVSCVETKDSYSLGGLFPVPKWEAIQRAHNNLPSKPEPVSTPANESPPPTPVVPIQADIQLKGLNRWSNAAGKSISESITVATRSRWNDPEAEQKWQNWINGETRLSTEPRMQGANAETGEGLLEAFGIRYMPNTYQYYQDVRNTALEIAQGMDEVFPKGRASDSSGGELYSKAAQKRARVVAEMFRRHDELCFFYLLHQAGVFSDAVLSKYDARKIAIWLPGWVSTTWSCDRLERPKPLSAEDATFASKYLPETLAGYQRLLSIFDEGTVQYKELEEAAQTVDAARFYINLLIFHDRLKVISEKLGALQGVLLPKRLAYAMGDENAEGLSRFDDLTATDIQKFEKNMTAKAYFVHRTTEKVLTLPGGVPLVLVWCPAGSFDMGRSNLDMKYINPFIDQEPEDWHRVVLTEGFWLAKYEVTQAQWNSIMGKKLFEQSGDDLPADGIDWNNSVEFCKRVGHGLRLPTEAQWEYACRAGTKGPFAGTGNLATMGWFWGNSDRHVHPVGRKLPNAWGLYDMHGNVCEWCRDGFERHLGHQSVTNPICQTTSETHVYRGGNHSDIEQFCRSASRAYGWSSRHVNGFRVACPGY